MPKRKGYLYYDIANFDNLMKAYYKARKGKRSKEEVAEFEFNLEKNLLDIEEKLMNFKFEFSGYKTFKIQEPKERLISCAPFKDRVVHHAICNVLEPIIDKTIIYDSYACRKGKGLHYAIQRAFKFYQKNEYVYKFDIRKYFYTIDHEILLSKIKRKIKDPHLIKLLDGLLVTHQSSSAYYLPFDDDTIFDFSRKRGLPIGNLTSQIFANFYLSGLDHYLKEDLHCKNYVRYMDDMLIFTNSKEELEEIKLKVADYLSKIRLHIHPHKNQISKTKHGVNFLGFRFKDNQIKLQNRNLVRFKRKLRDYSKKQLSVDEISLSFNGHLGYFNSGHCKKIVTNILNEFHFIDGTKKYKLVI